MTGEEMRAALVAALRQAQAERRLVWGSTEVADALLPVVRRIAADELRAAAEVVRDDHGTASLPAKWIDARADALDGES